MGFQEVAGWFQGVSDVLGYLGAILRECVQKLFRDVQVISGKHRRYLSDHPYLYPSAFSLPVTTTISSPSIATTLGKKLRKTRDISGRILLGSFSEIMDTQFFTLLHTLKQIWKIIFKLYDIPT